jgi:MFS family permease
VLWWSAFTSLTGFVSGYYALLVTRFLFGAGGAGAYPNASVVVARCFPLPERGRAFGITLMAAQLGGAVAPLLVVPIQMRYGWRASFYTFGILGVLWSGIWYSWFRDSPPEEPGVGRRELDETRGLTATGHQRLPWGVALRSNNFRAIMIVALCYVYTFYFFQSWFHTYLVKARGYQESDLLLSSLPFLVAACANFGGGMVSNTLVTRIGLRWGRCGIGVVSLTISGLCAIAVMFTHHQIGAMNTVADRLVSFIIGVRIHPRSFWQLRFAVRPNGGTAGNRCLALAPGRSGSAADCRRAGCDPYRQETRGWHLKPITAASVRFLIAWIVAHPEVGPAAVVE